jgi:glycine/D-amino acid oxidase-like deaminating enzyme
MGTRIVVVGAGIVGTCISLRLAQRGADVTLIDERGPGEGTSGTSFAWLDASHPSLEPYVGLNIAGLEAWRRLGQGLGDPEWLRLTGTITWETDREAADALTEHAAALRELGHPSVELSPDQLTELEPDLVVDDGVEAILMHPTEGFLWARPAIAELLARGRAAGLSVRTGSVASFACPDGERVTGVVLSSGETVPADRVITCVGRWTEQLLGTADVAVPLTGAEPAPSPAVGLLVLTTAVPARLRTVVFANGLMMRPDGAGRLLLHGDEQDTRVRADTGVIPPPDEAHELVELARARLRGAQHAAVESATIGIRALPVDRVPVVGPVREGLYVVVTHSGMTLAPALGEIVAAEILDEMQSDALDLFRPARFERAMI